MRDAIPQQMDHDAEMVYDILKSYGGRFPYTDKSVSPEVVKSQFGISKVVIQACHWPTSQGRQDCH